MPKDLNYYLGLPYTVIVRKDAQGDFVAKVEELAGCSAHGKTQREALQAVEEAKMVWITDCVESADPVPEPSVEEGLPSGKWLQRVPRSLHRKLVQQARREGVSLNQLVTSSLAEAMGAKSGEGSQQAPGTRLEQSTKACFATFWVQERPSNNWAIHHDRATALSRASVLRKRLCGQGGRKRNFFRDEDLIHEKEIAHHGK